MTKREFEERVKLILETSKRNADAMSGWLASGSAHERVISELAGHDPELAKLVQEADTCALEPLNRIVRYLSQRVEN